MAHAQWPIIMDTAGNALMAFMTNVEAASLRSVDSASRAAVAAFPWRDPTVELRHHVAAWQASFPAAKSITLDANCGPMLHHAKLRHLTLCTHDYVGTRRGMGAALRQCMPQLVTLELTHDFNTNVQRGEVGDLLNNVLVPMPHLVSLRICHNKIGRKGFTALTTALETGGMPLLQLLRLEHTGFDSVSAERLGIALASNNVPHLTTLCISHNSPYTNDFGATALANALFHVRKLTELRFCVNCIHDSAMTTIANAVAAGAVPCLAVWDMTGNAFGDIGTRAIATALDAVPCLRELLLGNNNITTDGIQALATALQHNPTPNLVCLDVNCNKIRQEGAAALAAALPHVRQLQILRIGHNPLEDAGFCALASSMSAGHTPCITELDFTDTELRVDGAHALVRAFANMPHLAVLKVRCARLPSASIKELISALQCLPALTTLAIRVLENREEECFAEALSIVTMPLLTHLALDLQVYAFRPYFRTTGMHTIGAALHTIRNTVLKTLDMSMNRSDNDGIVLVANAIAAGALPHLEELNMSFNDIEDTGAVAIAAGLAQTPNMTKLLLRSGVIHGDGGLALVHALRHVPRLIELDLRNNHFSTACTPSMEDAVAVHSKRQLKRTRDPFRWCARRDEHCQGSYLV